MSPESFNSIVYLWQFCFGWHSQPTVVAYRNLYELQMTDLLFFIIKLLVNIKAPVSLRQTVTISSTKASGKNAYKIFIIQFGLVKHASFHESFSPYIITRDAPKWKFLVETEKEETKAGNRNYANY